MTQDKFMDLIVAISTEQGTLTHHTQQKVAAYWHYIQCRLITQIIVLTLV